uniref:AlNc14C115G6523 protein n=1 Tax=Albugo laibachii Nc14 TaxID=890382 RepID=F0WIY7_9STRA|nr:AlNc14C115G6523 [Albugo laibachii Nc14]|eukprot:CCA21233.1 AlNc14C115G6523 [Albugo laibachii Nc14]
MLSSLNENLFGRSTCLPLHQRTCIQAHLLDEGSVAKQSLILASHLQKTHAPSAHPSAKLSYCLYSSVLGRDCLGSF